MLRLFEAVIERRDDLPDYWATLSGEEKAANRKHCRDAVDVELDQVDMIDDDEQPFLRPGRSRCWCNLLTRSTG